MNAKFLNMDIYIYIYIYFKIEKLVKLWKKLRHKLDSNQANFDAPKGFMCYGLKSMTHFTFPNELS